MCFTIPEKRLIDNRYFSIIRSDITFYEIKSRDSGHYWIIKKISSDTSNPIQVFHKHSNGISYYHRHKLTFSVKDAIKIIMEHDVYVVSQI